MSTLLQAADGMTLKSKALLFFALTVLLTLTAVVGVLHGSADCSWNAAGALPVFVLATLALLLAVQAVAMLCFRRQVLLPLADVNAAARQMTDGHLDSLSRIKRQDEIGRLGENLNDLAVNTQEVLLFVWNHGQQSRELLDQLEARLDAWPDSEAGIVQEMKEDVERMRQDNEDLKAIVMSFSYFEIRLEQEKMLADMVCEDRNS